MLNYDMLLFLGFTRDEIHFVECALQFVGGALITPSAILRRFIISNNIQTNLNFNKLNYLANIVVGNSNKRVLSALELLRNFKGTLYSDTYRSSDEFKALEILARHFTYMRNNFGFSSNTGNSIEIRSNRDLPQSMVTEVVELAEISGIEDEAFSIYNSDRYEDNSRYLKVKKRGNTVQLEPKRLPVLKYGNKPKIDGIIEVRKDEYSNFGEDSYTLYINNKFVKLLNTFVICVSVRMPDSHLGMIDIVTDNGSRIYVYATEWTAKNRRLSTSSNEYNSNQSRIVDYGYTNKQLEDKLASVATKIFKMYNKKLSLYVSPVVEYDSNKRIEPFSNQSINNNEFKEFRDTYGETELDLGLDNDY